MRTERDATVKRLENAVRTRLRDLRRAIASGDDSQLVCWVLDGKLACAQRPLRDHPKFGGRGPLPPETRRDVREWVDRIVALGFRSVICLSHAKELCYYDGLKLHPDGLLGFLQASGLQVRHLPWLDPAHASTPEERERRRARVEDIKLQARSAFDRMVKPVLLFCSAGIDRSPPVAAFIAASRVRDVDSG